MIIYKGKKKEKSLIGYIHRTPLFFYLFDGDCRRMRGETSSDSPVCGKGKGGEIVDGK